MNKFDKLVNRIGKYKVGNRTTYKVMNYSTLRMESRFGIIRAIKTHGDGLVEIFVRDCEDNTRNCKFVRFDPVTDIELEAVCY